MKVHPVSHTAALFYIFFFRSLFCFFLHQFNCISLQFSSCHWNYIFFVDRYLLKLRIKIGSNGNLFYKHRNETMPQATKFFISIIFFSLSFAKKKHSTNSSFIIMMITCGMVWLCNIFSNLKWKFTKCDIGNFFFPLSL